MLLRRFNESGCTRRTGGGNALSSYPTPFSWICRPEAVNRYVARVNSWLTESPVSSLMARPPSCKRPAILDGSRGRPQSRNEVTTDYDGNLCRVNGPFGTDDNSTTQSILKIYAEFHIVISSLYSCPIHPDQQRNTASRSWSCSSSSLSLESSPASAWSRTRASGIEPRTHESFRR